MLNQLKRGVSLIIGLVLAFYSSWLITQEKIHFGVLVPFVIGVALCLYAIFFNKILTWVSSSSRKNMLWKTLWLLFWIWLISVLLFFGYIQQHKDAEANNLTAKAVIVLGGGVENAQPTPTLKNRLDRAAIYAMQYPAMPVIVSGGLVFGQTYSEAEIMRRYLISQYPNLNNAIEVEKQSTSTALNLEYSKKILAAKQIKLSDPIILVTSDFHTLRAKAIAEHQGYRNIKTLSAPTPLYIRYHSWLREYFAYLSGWLLGEY